MRFRNRRTFEVTRREEGTSSTDAASALAAADELLAQGEPVRAIELLSASNRRRRDDRLEQRLVRMRFEAFAMIDASGGRGTAPEVAVDLFPGAGIPEIAAADLNIERVSSAVLQHGCCIVRGLVGTDRVDLLVNDIDCALAAYDSTVGSTSLGAVPPWFVPFGHERGRVERKFRREVGGVLAVDSPPALFDVIETFEAVGIRRIVREFFGEQPALLAKKWTLRRVPHDSGESGWHQDGAFMGGDIRSLNVWLALSHCGDDSPGLDIVARRLDEIVPTGGHDAWLDWNVGPSMVEQVAQGAVTRPIFDAGDAVIFDHMLLHRTAVDPGMTRDRYAIEAWFLAPSTYGSMMGGGEGAQTPPRDQLPMLY